MGEYGLSSYNLIFFNFFFILFFCAGQCLFQKGKANELLRKSVTFVYLKKKIHLVSHLESDANNTCDILTTFLTITLVIYLPRFDILTTFCREIQANISHQIGKKINQGRPF